MPARAKKVTNNGTSKAAKSPKKAAEIEYIDDIIDDDSQIQPRETILNVPTPNFQYVQLRIRGTSIYAQHRFGTKAMEIMHEQQMKGEAARSTKKREAKNFEQLYHDAMHVSTEGWHGIPSSCFRNAMIDACRTVGVVMTRAKLAVFVLEDGIDKESGEPLTRITKGEPYPLELPVRNATGVIDLRVRPAWSPGWEALVTIRYDADMIGIHDIVNLMVRVGMQVGIGEGRPSSRKSNGIGWGLFEVEIADDED